MTCIVGLKTTNGVILGGDSAASTWNTVRTLAYSKVFSKDGTLYGFTGTIRMGQLLRYSFQPPARDGQEVMAYLVTRWTDALRTTFKDAGFASKENEVERGGHFLIGYDRRLFHIEGNYQVFEASDGFDAVGSGEEYALGALHATAGEKPMDRVRIALDAAARFTPTVAPPYRIVFSGSSA